MLLEPTERLLDHVRALLVQDRIADVVGLLAPLRPSDTASVLARLKPADQDALLGELQAHLAAQVLQEIEEAQAAELASRMDDARLAQIVDTMEPDEAADLLNDLAPVLSAAVLAALQSRDQVRPLLGYPDDTAGGLMRADMLPVYESMEAGEALQLLIRLAPRGKQSPHFAVITPNHTLLGVVSVFELLRAPTDALVRDLMDSDVVKAHVWDRAEEAARLLAHYRLDAIPVVDDADRLAGVITGDDLVEVLEEAATEDAQRFGGSAPLRRSYFGVPALTAAGKRLGWLALLFATGALTAAIIRFHQGTLDRAVALAAFIPLLIGSGGNAGSQTIAIIIRALATRDVAPRDALHVLWRELRIAVLLGVLMAMGGYVVAQLSGANQQVSITVAASLLAILIWANLVGAMLPLAARAAGLDPALVSGPLMSTLVDTIGLLIYFAVAVAVLYRLGGGP